MILVVMGVAGVGKTTVGEELARRLECKFVDADTYHSPENILKMSRGEGLTDEDRAPWLKILHRVLADFERREESVVLACSALKQTYRVEIGAGLPVIWIYLKADPDKIRERLLERHGHYASARLLESQLAALEEPIDAIVVNADNPPDSEIDEVMKKVGRRESGAA
jgi:carbohydrate kinase (thermoresistant glucokinase family)